MLHNCAAAERYQKLAARFRGATFSEDAVRGIRVAAEALGPAGIGRLDEIIEGTAITAERAEKAFAAYAK
jgi:hypothetical protein